MIKKKILIATGGTGGHVFPAYSLANYLTNENFSVKLTTDKRGSIFLKDYNNLNLAIIPSSPLIRKSFFLIALPAATPDRRMSKLTHRFWGAQKHATGLSIVISELCRSFLELS